MILGSGRSPREGNGYPLQYFSLENSMDRAALQAIYSPWGHKELDTTERLQYRVVIRTCYDLLSEWSKSDREREISHDISHMWNLKKIRWYKWTYLQNRNILSKGMGGHSKGVWDWHVHTLLYLKWITCKDLLCSILSWNSGQYSITT